jgi:FkbM family methyltransferase
VIASAKALVRKALRGAGWHMHRYSPATVPEAQIHALLAHHCVDLVLDVGANAGQYAETLRDSGYSGRILSFEPLESAWATCTERARGDALWTVAPRMALGAVEDTVTLNVAGNSASSSILPMRDTHLDAAPHSAYVGQETVPLHRLDRVAVDAITAAEQPFLKIDTQGYERPVLEGATGVLDRIVGVQLEISLTALYEGSATLAEILALMERYGFAVHALLPAFTDTRTGRMLQVDGLFFRET